MRRFVWRLSRKDRAITRPREAVVLLHRQPGHAEVDFGEAEAVAGADDRPPQFLTVHGLLER